MKSLLVKALYLTANVCCILADKLSPSVNDLYHNDIRGPVNDIDQALNDQKEGKGISSDWLFDQ